METDVRTRQPFLTVAVLAYNERASLAAVCDELALAMASLSRPSELLIVDDGSNDGTGEAAEQWTARYQTANPGEAGSVTVRVLHHVHNLGLGGGYRTGFAEANGEYLSFFPADGQFDPAEILPRFVAELDGGADLVLGYLPHRKSSPLAKGLSAAERVLYAAMFGSFPRFQGILMIRTAIVRTTPLVSQGRGWAVVMELILRTARSGARVVNVPNTLRPRQSGQSKVNNWRTIVANLRQVVPLWRALGRG
jgi:dolichol-phosphate mannosyltransferase